MVPMTVDLKSVVKTSWEKLEGQAILQDGTAVGVEASVRMQADSTTIAELQSSQPFLQLRGPEAYDLHLESTDGWQLTCERCRTVHRSSGHVESSPLRAQALKGDASSLANSGYTYAMLVGGDAPFCGDEFDESNSRTVIDATATGRDAWLRGVRLAGIDKELGYMTVSADGRTLSEDRVFAERVASLSSLAYVRFIQVPWLGRFGADAAVIELTQTGSFGGAPPILYVEYPQQLSNLLNNGLRAWNTQGKGLDLPHLIQLYILARSEQFVEASLMLASIWLEALKHRYAVNIAHLQQNSSGYFLKPDGTRYSFKELMQEAFRHFAVKGPDDSFITNVRNPVIHTGTVNLGSAEKLTARLEIGQCMEDFLLSILGFTGLIWDYQQARWVQKK